ncbi:FAD-binding protein [Variovorax ginsengisoli]|uniref:FAD-binding protein n=1 Tax=Variovorax ginsengisoli TaxID=363844 RepID=A0ABT8SBC2_9BURK|nr:FAD-binding protein [Variovorax ginsengisoli]MDN8617047.1 FAD-binding protein [Variovorax ginsengisoli]MDO1536217.1 FAD-binding protein [Variovorax ginsengisoli]
MTNHHIVNDVTQLNPVRVMAIVAPACTGDVVEALRRTSGPVSIGGGRFSMGGQTASPGSLHFDMRSMNRILAFSPDEKTIRVQPGVRWCDIQRFVDPHGLAVKIMQTYANFTVGGALSVNCHGRYVGLGPLVLSIRSIEVALHDGRLERASRTHNPELFYGVIGGYGGLGVVVEIELDLAENKRVLRVDKVMPLSQYWTHFKNEVRNNPKAVFHNADLYAPHYASARSVTWVETDRPATTSARLQPLASRYPLHQYFLWAVSETPFGKERREKLVDPLLYLRKKVHWRNYEAGYDVAELEPPSRKDRTYVLQEYFVPVEQLEAFVPLMAAVLRRHRVNALNVSIRHAMPDPNTLLSWAPRETFAFVLYHKQRTRENARSRVGVWTRELIDAVLSVGGTYYLPYQPHGTEAQFHRAYPRAREYLALKERLDPDFRFTNVLWNKYHKPGQPVPAASDAPSSEFHQVFGDVRLSDAFYRFLQSVFRTLPEDRFHQLIRDACKLHKDEESVYRYLQSELKGIKPMLADLTHALPSLVKQKAEMTRQTLQLLGERKRFSGYAEIGSKGRYFRGLASALDIGGPCYFIDEKAPTFSPVDIMERGQLRKLEGRHLPLADYAPLPADPIADASLDLVACYVGLHHMTVERLRGFLASVNRVLRPGGVFIVRDHDVRSEELRVLVSLAHTVFNAGLGETWETNRAELRFFEPVATWVERLAQAGFKDSGARILQDNDPTDNVLLCFTKEGRALTGSVANDAAAAPLPSVRPEALAAAR